MYVIYTKHSTELKVPLQFSLHRSTMLPADRSFTFLYEYKSILILDVHFEVETQIESATFINL